MKWLVWLLIVFVIFAVGIVRHYQQPVYYHLTVINNSQQVVRQVSVFGEGVLAPSFIGVLAPGRTQSISVELGDEGELRVEVKSGLNKIDHIVSKDISYLEFHRQKLSINPDNHYIFSSQE